MPTATITSKGQITIPVEIRREMGLEEGAQVEFVVNAQQRIELIPRNRDLRALRGSIRALGPVSVEAMHEVAAKQWVSRAPSDIPSPAGAGAAKGQGS